MKKTLLVAVIAAIGLAFASCEADPLSLTNTPSQQLSANGSLENALPLVSDDGPGDDVIILIPPKRP